MITDNFQQYYERLRKRRDEDEYIYTDSDLEENISFIKDCYVISASPYICLEMMFPKQKPLEDS